MADLTEAELQQIGEAFKSLGVKPKADTPADLDSWMKEYVKQKGVSASSVHVHAQLPRIVIFSGEPKGDQVSFDVWKYDVKCLINEGLYKEPEIYQATRKSLRGEASRIAMRLGPNATVRELIAKLDGIYGIVEPGENLLAQFYSAFQKQDEDVAAWGCRLEDIIEKAVEQGQVKREAVAEMLYSKFWMGLKQNLKDATRHNFENINDFDKLRVQIRRVEHELMLSSGLSNDVKKKDKKDAQIKMVSAQESSSIEELKAMVCSLSKKVDAMQGQKATSATSSHDEIKPQTLSLSSDKSTGAKWGSQKWTADNLAGNQGRGKYDFGPGPYSRGTYGRGTYGRETHGGGTWQPNRENGYNFGRGRGMMFQNRGRGSFSRQPSQTNWDRENQPFTQEPQCWRCGQMGHIQYGCRVILDHKNKPLN